MELIVIGGGLAGSEAAWQAAQRGVRVKLYEMRPEKQTGAHASGKGKICSLRSINLSHAIRRGPRKRQCIIRGYCA